MPIMLRPPEPRPFHRESLAYRPGGLVGVVVVPARPRRAPVLVPARATGLTLEELREAVLQRARDDAADLDDFAAESLLARVHQAIWDAPKA